MDKRLRMACFALAVSASWISTAVAQATLEIKDFVVMPMTGTVDGKGGNASLLARVNTLREEAGGA